MRAQSERYSEDNSMLLEGERVPENEQFKRRGAARRGLFGYLRSRLVYIMWMPPFLEIGKVPGYFSDNDWICATCY